MLSYHELQEKYCRLKIGDKVLLVRTEESHYNGWACSWKSEIKIGNIGFVKEINKMGGVCVHFNGLFRVNDNLDCPKFSSANDGIYYPYYCLELLEDPEDFGISLGDTVKVENSTDGSYIVNKIYDIKSNCISVDDLEYAVFPSQVKLISKKINRNLIIPTKDDKNGTSVYFSIAINDNGSIKFGCSTVDNKDVDKIIEIRNKVLKNERKSESSKQDWCDNS